MCLTRAELQSPEVPKRLTRTAMLSAGCGMCSARAGEASPCALGSAWLCPKTWEPGGVLSACVGGWVNKENMWHYILKDSSARSEQRELLFPEYHRSIKGHHTPLSPHTLLSEGILPFCSPPEQGCPDHCFLVPSQPPLLPRSRVCLCMAAQTAFQHFPAQCLPSSPVNLSC